MELEGEYLAPLILFEKGLRLTEDILDVQKIESRTLKLNKERFDLNDLVLCVVDDYKNQIGHQNRNLKLIQQLDNASPMWVEGDKYRIIQVISNLLGEYS
jgi:signal transduction histidine kinase